MSQLNDCMLAALGEGQLNDLLLKYYQGAGATSGCLSDAEYEYLIIEGATPGTLNDMWFEFLGSHGYEGTLNDRQLQFWCGTAPPVPYYFWFEGDGYVDSPADIDFSLPNRMEYTASIGDALLANRDMWATIDSSCLARMRTPAYNWRTVRGTQGANVNGVVFVPGITYEVEESCDPIEAVNVLARDTDLNVQSGQAFPVLAGTLQNGFRIAGSVSRWIGMIKDFHVYNNVGTLIHSYAIDEGEGVIIIDSVGGAHGTLVPGTGYWAEDVIITHLGEQVTNVVTPVTERVRRS